MASSSEGEAVDECDMAVLRPLTARARWWWDRVRSGERVVAFKWEQERERRACIRKGCWEVRSVRVRVGD
jgi:hypothetical protein